MSSRFGPRATGTDGSDFHHRQQIATHYRESVVYKFRLKILLGLHMFLMFPVGIKLFEDILDRIGRPWSALAWMRLPDSSFWEYWWFSSVIGVIIGMLALPKNKEKEMRWCYYVLFGAGIMPITVGGGELMPELIAYIGDPRIETHLFMGKFPMVVLWFMFFFVAIQIHAFSMYFAFKLIKLWQPATPPAVKNKAKDDAKSLENVKKSQ